MDGNNSKFPGVVADPKSAFSVLFVVTKLVSFTVHAMNTKHYILCSIYRQIFVYFRDIDLYTNFDVVIDRRSYLLFE